MKRRLGFLSPVLVLLVAAAAVPAAADDVWVADILANPARHWNMTVTVSGQVMTVTPNPAGTTRGTYTLLDDSTPQLLTVRSKDLPPAGKSFRITGVIIQDPTQTNVPVLNELERSDPGMGTLMRNLLIAAAVLFALLLVVFVFLLLKPKRAAMQPTVYAPATSPPAPAPTPAPAATAPPASAPTPPSDATRKMSAPSAGEKTQVFTNLGAELVVDRGPDAGRELTLHKQVTTIGRPGARKNDLELTDDTVSKEQASLFFDNSTKGFTMTNQSTTNPTLVNKKIVTESTTLADGDQIEMGSTVLTFRVT